MVAWLVAATIGQTVVGTMQLTFYERLGFLASHEGLKLYL